MAGKRGAAPTGAQEFDPAIVLADVKEHPQNPRRGNDEAVAESIRANGFYGGIVVQKSTGLVIAGNTRYRVAVKDGAESIPGFWLDVDDDTATRIMLADNRTSDVATYDDRVLAQMLSDLRDSNDGLTGTLFSDAEVESLVRSSGLLADEAVSFLDGIDGADGPRATSNTLPPPNIGMVPVSFVLSPENKDAVLRHLQHVKDSQGLDTVADALVVVCQ